MNKKKEMLYMSRASGSLAHTAGNITQIITEYYKDKFPQNFFKNTHVSTRLSFKNFQNLKSFVDFKKNKPIIAVQPKVNIDDVDFLTKAYFNSYTYDLYDERRPDHHLDKFFNDHNNKIHMDYMINRIRMTFDITMIFETMMQQVNAYSYLANVIRIDKPYFIERNVESEIPKALLTQLSHDIGIPIIDENKSVAEFMTYLNQNSNIPITFKTKYSTGNQEFFLFDIANIMINISRPNMDDGERRGMTSDNFTISQTIEIEFNYPALFYYISPSKHKVVQESILSDKYNLNLVKSEIVPFMTIQVIPIDKVNDKGWHLATSVSYQIDSDYDELDLKTVLNKRIIDTIMYNNTNGISQSTFIEYTVVKRDNGLEIDKYTIDFDRLVLINQAGDLDEEYRLIMYCDNNYINEVYKNKNLKEGL